jgi:hypothetical protein
MAGNRQVRWVCPNGLHPGVLGPTRPRRDNIVRYCLACSEKAGKLVEREAPALVKKRSERQQVTQSRAKLKQQREREAARRQTHIPVREVDGSLGEIDVKRTIRRMMKLAVIKEYADKHYYWSRLPEPTIRYSEHKPYTSGHAHTGSYVFTITVPRRGLREEIEETILHEICHLILPSEEWHGRRFRRVLTLAAREYWPGIEVQADYGAKWDLDHKITQEAIRIKETA